MNELGFKIRPEIDVATNTAVNIEQEHHEIHEGDHYNYCDYDTTVTGTDVINFVMTTSDTPKWVHLTFNVYSATGATIELYEAPTTIAGGSTITPRNNNRNSTKVSTVTIIKDPSSIGGDGTRTAGYLAGTKKSGGAAERSKEFILQQNTAYLVRITSLAASNLISWCIDWYEHINKSS